MELINSLIIPALWETLYMVSVSSLFSVLVGIVLGIILYVTATGNILENPVVYFTLDTVVNFGRSIPFIILIVSIIPFTTWLVGTFIGSTATIIPLTIAAIPFVARVMENAFKELDYGVIEAAMSFGASKWEIIFKVLLPETSHSIVHGITLTVINIIGYSAMAGAVGGGGLGDVAIRYGFQRWESDVMLICVVIIVFLVMSVQFVGTTIGNNLNKR